MIDVKEAVDIAFRRRMMDDENMRRELAEAREKKERQFDNWCLTAAEWLDREIRDAASRGKNEVFLQVPCAEFDMSQKYFDVVRRLLTPRGFIISDHDRTWFHIIWKEKGQR